MRAGDLVFQGTLEELRGRGSARILVRTPEPELAARCWPGSGWPTSRRPAGEVSALLGDQAPEDICAALVHAGVPVAGLETPRPAWRTCSSS